MMIFLEAFFCIAGLFLLVLGAADATVFLLSMVLPDFSRAKEVIIKSPDSAEMQLRSLLWDIRCGNCRGNVTVLVDDGESYEIAGKILRKYPNIGLLYRKDLHYNIK